MVAGAEFDITSWLDRLGLARYGTLFADNDIDDQVLPALTADDLRDVGVASIGHRRLLLDAAKNLRADRERAADPDATVVAERRVVTVMFCDLIDSTALSVASDPEDYVDYIKRFRQELDAAIEPFKGHIAQYLGDGVMASFGYPTASDHDAERAVAAGLAVVARVARMPKFGDHQPQVRVGIATGLTVVGGHDATLAVSDKSAIGEIPNFAARLQSVAQADTVVIAQTTRDMVGDLFECVDQGDFQLKGLGEPARVWRVLGRSSVGSRFDAIHETRRGSDFVGRTEETGRLSTLFTLPQEQRRSLVVISGEAGIGKSRLVREALADAGTPADQCLVLQCSPYGIGVAFSPVTYFLADSGALSAVDRPGQALDKLWTLAARTGDPTPEKVALLGHLLGIDGVPTSQIESMHSIEIRARTLQLLGEIMVNDPLADRVVVVEDMQWIDPSTIELIEGVLPQLRTRGVTIVATSTERPPTGWVERHDGVTIDVHRLEPLQISAMLAALAEPRVVPPEVAAAIVERSDGIPLFAEELIRGYLEALDSDEVSDAIGQVPLSLAESIVARLDRMVYGRRIASIAAAIGREFPITILLAVSDLPASVVHTGIGELLAADVIAPGQSQFGDAIQFRQQLVRDAAYDLLLRRERVSLHRRIADCLEEQFPIIAARVPHVVAFQRSAADQHEAASLAWESAGTDASNRSAYAEAVGYLSKAILSNDHLDPGRLREERELELRLALLGPLICDRGYQATEVGVETERITELSRSIGAVGQLMPALQAQWVQLGSRNDVRASRDLALRVRDAAAEGSTIDRLLASRMCGTSMLFSGELQGALRHYHDFMQLYVPADHGEQLRGGHSDHATMVMLGLAEVHTLQGDIALADDWRQRALTAARDSGRHHDRCHTLVFAGCLHPYLMRRTSEVADGVAELGGLLAELALPNWSGYLDLFNGVLMVERGDADVGLAVARRGYDNLLAARLFGNWWHVVFAEACIDAGQCDQAADVLATAQSSIDRGGLQFLAEFLRLSAQIAHRRDCDLSAAFAHLDRAEQVAIEQSANVFIGRIRRNRDALEAFVATEVARSM